MTVNWEQLDRHGKIAECTATVTNNNGSKTLRKIRFTRTASGTVRIPRVGTSGASEGSIEIDAGDLVSVLAELGF